MTIQSFDIVKVKRLCDDSTFDALVLGAYGTGGIYALLVWVDEDHPLGAGWVTRYAGINSLTKVEA